MRVTEIERLRTLMSMEYDYTKTYETIQNLFNTETFKLKEAQFQALAPISYFRRGFFSCGVGHGKTLISLLSPLVARSHRAIILVPSSLVAQLTEVEIPKYEKEFNLHFDWCSIAGKSQHQRRALMNAHRITIVPYSLLSSEDTFTLLEESKADMIIADECQYLKNKDAARTKRLLKYLDKNHPSFVCMSGTVIKQDLRDYWHLISRCLGKLSPLPFDWNAIVDMQDTITPEYDFKKKMSPFFARMFPETRTDTTSNSNFVYVDEARKKIKELFDCSPGTVRTENQSVDCSMQVSVLNSTPPKELADMLQDIRTDWTTPFGDFIEDTLQQDSILSQVSSGFYYRLFWPDGTPKEVIKEFEKQNELKKNIRKFLKHHRGGIDTPGLVMKALHIRDRGVSQLQSEFDDVDDWDLPERERETIHVSDYRIQEAKTWAKKKKKGIIWYKWDASGPQLHKAIKDATFCPADCPIENLQKNGILICSFAHKEGKNMQQHNQNYLFNFPSNAADFEQLMGRTHRQGQIEDCVYYDILECSAYEEDKLKKVVKQAKFLRDVDKEQKLLLADWTRTGYKL